MSAHPPFTPPACALTALPALALIRISGADAQDLLNRLLSSDVKALTHGQAQWSSFNTAKGRMIASLLLCACEEAINVIVSADLASEVMKKFRMYALRSQVHFEQDAADKIIALAGSAAADTLTQAGWTLPTADLQASDNAGGRLIRINAETFLLLCAADNAAAGQQALLEHGAVAAEPDCWTRALIAAGVGWIDAANSEQFVAQMLDFERIGGISFQKGCYPGQEIIARTQYLGKAKRQLCHLRGDVLLPAGTALFCPQFGQQEAGRIVLSAAAAEGGTEALAVVRVEAGDSLHPAAPASGKLQRSNAHPALSTKD